jgi:hypothetical protein
MTKSKKTNTQTTSENNTLTSDVTNVSAVDAPTQENIQGRGAFIVEITAAGVAVASTLVTEDGRALAMPAIFPNLSYALSQIDEMRALVVRHFEQASQIGAQVIAQQLAQQAQQPAVKEGSESKGVAQSVNAS